MFIEKLWEEKPELLIDGLSYVLGFDKSRFETNGKSYDGVMLFHIKSTKGYGYSDVIRITDFDIHASMGQSLSHYTKMQWIKFMYKVCGEKYAEEYITYRNDELDKFMHNYEKSYNENTIKVLAEIGVKKYQDMRNQTK